MSTLSDNPTWHKKRFWLDGSPKWEGLTTGELWEGWGCPYFTWVVAVKVVSWPHLGIDRYYDYREDAFYTRPKDNPHGEWIKWESIEIDGVTHYRIGAFACPWHVDSEE